MFRGCGRGLTTKTAAATLNINSDRFIRLSLELFHSSPEQSPTEPPSFFMSVWSSRLLRQRPPPRCLNTFHPMFRGDWWKKKLCVSLNHVLSLLWASCKRLTSSPWTAVEPLTPMSRSLSSPTRRRSLTPRCTRRRSIPSSTKPLPSR